MENGPWTILADGKGEMVNTAIIPESQIFTQSNHKEVKAACMIILSRDQCKEVLLCTYPAVICFM